MDEVPPVRYARSADGIDIAYQLVGEGPIDLVFVSGFVSHLDLNWDFPWYNWPRRMSGIARVLMFDKRGTGLSDRSLGFGSLADRMDDVRTVMDAAGIDKAVLYGVSEGGPMSLLFAATYPDRVLSLIVYGASAGGMMDAGTYSVTWTEETIDAFLADLTGRWGTGTAFDIIAQHRPDDDDTQRALARFERAACTPQMVDRIMRANAAIDIRDILPSISVPTLVCHNVGDPLVPVEHGRYIAQRIPGARYVEGPGDWHATWNIGEYWWIAQALAEFLGSPNEDTVADRVLSTVLFTDIVDSTRQAASVGDHRWRELLDHHDEAAKIEIGRHRGRLINTTGDGLLATFDGPARGIQCAQAIRKRVGQLGIDVRAGVHTGEIEIRGTDVSGLGVVIARRICDLADKGEVLSSRTVKELVTGSGIAFADRGTHTLKGVPEDWQLYAIAT